MATYTAVDPEGTDGLLVVLPGGAGSMTLTMSRAADAADADHFMISSDGVLSFKFSPDYEMPGDVGVTGPGNNTYKVVVVASDVTLVVGPMDKAAADRHQDGHKVTVMVTDVDEPGMVTLSALAAPSVAMEFDRHPDR